jgi:hypothetical protein
MTRAGAGARTGVEKVPGVADKKGRKTASPMLPKCHSGFAGGRHDLVNGDQVKPLVCI